MQDYFKSNANLKWILIAAAVVAVVFICYKYKKSHEDK